MVITSCGRFQITFAQNIFFVYFTPGCKDQEASPDFPNCILKLQNFPPIKTFNFIFHLKALRFPAYIQIIDMYIIYIYFTLKSFQGRVKLCRVNESIIVCINSLEILDGGIDPFRLFQSDQTIPVEVEAEKIVHRMAVDQVGVELTIGLGDGCGC